MAYPALTFARILIATRDVLAYCGLTWGEAVALRVHDVEFLKRRLVVSENAVQLGAHHAVGTTKGRKRPLGAGARLRGR